MTQNGITQLDVPRSRDLTRAVEAFLDEIGEWIDAATDRYTDAPATDVHDQATWTTSWQTYLAARPHERATAFLRTLRDRIHRHFVDTDQWHHGYWRRQEVHHGTEHFELFLGALWRIAPDDAATVEQFEDAAEHLGNWADDVPDWFDPATSLYRSMFLGTEVVDESPEAQLNIADHFRCINLALLGHEMTGRQRYLELASSYGRQWANAIVGGDRLPITLDAAGPVDRFGTAQEQRYRQFAGQAPLLRSDVDRAENLLTSNAPQSLLILWRESGEAVFRKAAERLLDILAGELDDPDAGAAAAALLAYRDTTGDRRYDATLREAVADLRPGEIERLGIEPEPDPAPKQPRPSGIGKRSDAPNWFEDGRPRRCHPITLAAAAVVSDDEALAMHAIDLARAYFAVARQVYPDGRHHGCTARSVSAIARGHGRENHAGVITAALGPILEHFT